MKCKRFIILFSALVTLLSFSAYAGICPDCGENDYFFVTEPATCTHGGYRETQCYSCGYGYYTPIQKLGHNFVESARQEPTSSEDGVITYQCSRCTEVMYETLERIQVVPSDTASLAKTWFSGVWGLFGVYMPGFGFTIGQMWLGISLCSVSVIVFRLFLGLGGSGVSSRTSSTAKPKISDNRKGDEY